MSLYRTRFRLAVFILATCTVPMAFICCSAVKGWQTAVRDASEQTLKNNLVYMRGTIRTYAIKRGELPQTLNDLADGGAFTLPDPITRRVDWQVTIGENPELVKGKRGIIDVHSASTAISSEGTLYNTW